MSTHTIQDTATSQATGEVFLQVRDLKVYFPTGDGVVKAVDGLSFDVYRGRTLGIVGESGSGKSVTSQAILGLHNRKRTLMSGSILLDGEDLITASTETVRALRGDKMSMIFQDPLSSMHPFYKIGPQIAEAYRVHNKVSKQAAKARVIEMLARVGIPNPEARFNQYPHEFSGGMRQRAMIAMALICHPQLLIADEPTTALDVTVQAQILELMKDLQKEFNSAIILITHDLGVVAETCDDVVVMYGGQCVERGTVADIFYRPEMPYTWGLLGSMPRLDRLRQERLLPIKGSPPSLINVPKGCVFNPRCQWQAEVGGDRCRTERPELTSSDGSAHEARCHLTGVQRRTLFDEKIKPAL